MLFQGLVRVQLYLSVSSTHSKGTSVSSEMIPKISCLTGVSSFSVSTAVEVVATATVTCLSRAFGDPSGWAESVAAEMVFARDKCSTKSFSEWF